MQSWKQSLYCRKDKGLSDLQALIVNACATGDNVCAAAEKDALEFLITAIPRPGVQLCARLYSSYASVAKCVKLFEDNSSKAADFQFPDRSAKSICDEFYKRKPDTVLRKDLCVEKEDSRRTDLLAVWDKLPDMTRFMCGWGIMDRDIDIPLYTSMTICVNRETIKSEGRYPGPFATPPEYMTETEFRALRNHY